MAEPNNSTSENAGLSRRKAMTMMTAVSAVPALALLPIQPAFGKVADRRAWDAALARFRAVEQATNEAVDRHSSAEVAADRECPRDAKWFEGKYQLGMGMSRDRARSAIGLALTIDQAQMPVLNPEACRKIDAEADRLADEFMAYQERHREADRHHRLPELQEQIEALHDEWCDARDSLMAVPAPDVPALLTKLEVATDFGGYAEQRGVLKDAKRLLGEGHA